MNNQIYRKHPTPDRIIFEKNLKSRSIQHKFVTDYENLSRKIHQHRKLAISTIQPELGKINSGVQIFGIGNSSQEDFLKLARQEAGLASASSLHKNAKNTYELHYMLGMTSRLDRTVIDERSTYHHVTEQKLKQVINLENIHAKQHIILGQDLYYDSSIKNKIVDKNLDAAYVNRLAETGETDQLVENQLENCYSIQLVKSTLPYFKLRIITENEDLSTQTLFKKLSTNLMGKLDCICKLVRVDRVDQIGFKKIKNTIEYEEFFKDNYSEMGYSRPNLRTPPLMADKGLSSCAVPKSCPGYFFWV